MVKSSQSCSNCCWNSAVKPASLVIITFSLLCSLACFVQLKLPLRRTTPSRMANCAHAE